MSTVADLRTPPSPIAEDPFRYGFRDEQVLQPDGTYKLRQVPLTLEDYLHPQEGDHFMEGSWHDFLRAYLRSVFQTRLEVISDALVLSNQGVYWDDPDLGHHVPDIAVIFGLRRQKDEWPSFHVAEEGVRPRLILELVSPLYRKVDVEEKLREYHQARVPIYVILDREHETDPWKIKAYRRNPQRYVLQPLEEDGRLWLEDVNLWLAVDGKHIRCFDGDTGREMLYYSALDKQSEARLQLIDAEKARANDADSRAEAEKARANDADSRAEAEKARANDADSRAEAEKARANDAAACAEAEKARADAEAAKRRQVEEELARLRAQLSGS